MASGADPSGRVSSPGDLEGPLPLLRGIFPGALVSVTIALAATFVSEHYGGPQLLYALLLGLSLHFLVEDARISRGVSFCAATVLRLGVALMGVRITLVHVSALGARTVAVIACAVALTILFGVLLARLFRRRTAEGIISGGSVAICGASAAMAISAVLPRTPENERFTLLTVVGVTVLSTVAMITYPIVARSLELDSLQAGIFLGGTIHDVAQVVAAGLILSPEVGDTATLVKLFRVLMLLPVVMVISLVFRMRVSPLRGGQHARPSLVPGFLIGFVLMVLLASTGALAQRWTGAISDASRWCLVTAIAAVGIKSSFQDLGKLGWTPVLMLAGESLFLAIFVALATLLAAV